jgi:hypothetical protein
MTRCWRVIRGSCHACGARGTRDACGSRQARRTGQARGCDRSGAADAGESRVPVNPGKAHRITDDYKRNVTTSVYAALEIATGEITGACYP